MSETCERALPCRDCPFRQRMTHEQLAAACEGEGEGEPGDCEMLCHESGSLDGRGPDLVCRGFQNNLGGTP
jgi:hypothetical protein